MKDLTAETLRTFLDPVRRVGLKLVFGPKSYEYLCQTLGQDRRLPRAHTVDIVVRKDGLERRIEADWLKTLARILKPDLPPPMEQP